MLANKLIKTQFLAKNVIINLVGYAVPLVVALFAMPALIHAIGTDKYGLLSLSWLIVGYFSFFDLGLGRVVSKMVSEKLGQNKLEDIQSIYWSGLFFMLLLGLLAAVISFVISSLLINHFLNIPEELKRQSLISFYILCFIIPVVTVSTGLRGVLEAFQKFTAINVIRILNGSFTFLGPLITSLFSKNLVVIISVLCVWRFCLGLLFFYFSYKAVSSYPTDKKLDTRLSKPMFKMGGWMSISNLINPFLVSIDRFLIGSVLTVSAVTYYVTPYEVVSKLAIITNSFVRVLFPAFSTSFASDPQKTWELYDRSLRFLVIILFPLVFFFITFLKTGLTIWVGEEFAIRAYKAAQWLTIGVLANSTGQLAFILIQAAGRADLTAKVHLIQLPIYIPVLYLFMSKMGITGAGLSWALRLVFETGILFWLARRFVKYQNINFLYFYLGCFVVAVVQIAIQSYLFFIAIIPIYIVIVWTLVLNEQEKKLVYNRMRILRN